MKIEMANVMTEDADHHVLARRIEIHVQVFFGTKHGHKPIFDPKPTPSWASELLVQAFSMTSERDAT